MPRRPGLNHHDATRASKKVNFEIGRQSKHVVMTDANRYASRLRRDLLKLN